MKKFFVMGFIMLCFCMCICQNVDTSGISHIKIAKLITVKKWIGAPVFYPEYVLSENDQRLLLDIINESSIVKRKRNKPSLYELYFFDVINLREVTLYYNEKIISLDKRLELRIPCRERSVLKELFDQYYKDYRK